MGLRNLKLHELSEAERTKREYCKKNAILQLFVFILLWSGCSDRKQSVGDIGAVDVTEIYQEEGSIVDSEQMLRIDNEIASIIEYIPLETNDEFLCGRGEFVTFTDEIIVYRNNSDGNIFLFDRKGKALKKINRRGQGPEEYTDDQNIVYDEANKELFVNCMASGKIVVYDLDGNFKRNFSNHGRSKDNDYGRAEIENYDKGSLICYVSEGVAPPLFLISKQTGEKIRDIIIPYEKKLYTELHWMEGNETRRSTSTKRTLVKAGNEIIISEPSSDTIYSLHPRESVLHPILYRTPPIQTMKVPIFLFAYQKVGPFLAMSCLKLDEEFKQQVFSGISYIYNYKDNRIYNLIFSQTQEFRWGGNGVNAVHNERNSVFLIAFEAEFLKEAEKNLTGELKEIASNLKEDDNPVVAIVLLKE